MTASARESSSRPAPASPEAPSLVPLTAPDGARSQARLFAPGASDLAPRAVAVCLPAMGVEASYYDPFGRALAARGVAALMSELRGVGTSSLRAGRHVDFGYRELVELDAVTAVAAARERFPGLPVHLVGHSLGGHVAVLFAAVRPRAVDGIALIAAGTPYFRAYPGRYKLYVFAGSVILQSLSGLLGYLPGRTVGFGGREARRLIAEWAGAIRTGRFDFAGAPADLPAALAAVDLPLLCVSLADDTLAPLASADHLIGMVPGARLTRLHAGRGELGDGIDHFRWVRRPDRTAQALVDWIQSVTGARAAP